MNTEKEFDTIKEIVEELLRKDARCRNDDKWLTYKVMSKFTKIYIPFEDFEKIPSFSTIDRCRRLLQNEFPNLRAAETTQLKRKEREKEVRRIVR